MQGLKNRIRCPVPSTPYLTKKCYPTPPERPLGTEIQQKKGLTLALQDPEDLVTGDALDLGDTMTVPEDDSDLGRRDTLPGELVDLVADLLRRDLEPSWWGSLVGEGGAGCGLRACTK